MTETLPRRNLPPEAEQWGRALEQQVQTLVSENRALRQQLENLARAVSGSLSGLSTVINFEGEGFQDNPYYKASGPSELGSSAPGALAMSGVGQTLLGYENDDVTWEDAPGATAATAPDAIAIGGGMTGGGGALVRSVGSIGIGNVDIPQGANYSTALGTDLQVLGSGGSAVAVGQGVTAGLFSVAIGSFAATADRDAPTSAPYGPIAIGPYSRATKTYSIAIGGHTESSGQFGVAIGEEVTIAEGSGVNAVAIGTGANVATSAPNVVAIGSRAEVSGDSAANAVAIGSEAKVNGAGALGIAIGSSALANGLLSVALGGTSKSTGEFSVAIGAGAKASGPSASSVAIGASSTASGVASIAIGGPGVRATRDYTTALGAQATATQPGAIALGTGATAGTQEVTHLATRDLDISRAPSFMEQLTPVGGLYGENPETGIILTDANGVKRRITIDTSGNLTVGSYAVPTPPPFEWDDLGEPGALTLLAPNADATILFARKSDGIYRSLDGGVTWTQESTITPTWLHATSDGTRGIATVGYGNLYATSDSGDTWTPLAAAGSRGWGSAAISDDGTVIIAGTTGNTAYVSTDSGATFTATTAADPESTARWVGLSADGSRLVAVTVYTGGGLALASVVTSLDAGATWNFFGLDFEITDPAAPLRPPHVSADGDTVVAFGDTGSWVTTDGGVSWRQVEGVGGPMVAVDDTATSWLTANPLRESTDGGFTFTTVSPAPPADVDAVTISRDGTSIISSADTTFKKPEA